MSPTLKAALALIFTAALGWVLLQPVLDAVEREPVAARPAPSSPPEVTQTPDPSPQAIETGARDRELPEGFRTGSLVSRYPRDCMRAAPPASVVIVVDRGDAIASGPRDGPLTELPGDRLFGVAVDGRIAGRVGNEAFVGAPGGGAVRRLPEVGLVVWSPVSPCGVAVSRGGALSALPSERLLLNEGVVGAAFSPNGRKLAVVVEEEQATSLWIVLLRDGVAREVLRESPGTRIEVRAWDPDTFTVYLTVGENEGLGFVTTLRTSAPSLTGRVTATPVRGFDYCGRRLLAVVDGGVAMITPRGPRYLTGPRSGYTAVSCSPDGAFLAALRSGDLVLLDGDGALVRELTTDAGYRDVFVDWGPRGAGLLFGRVPETGGEAELWHIPEGATARPTGITYRTGPDAVDWAATPPTGLP